MASYIELKQQAEDLLKQAEAARKAEIASAIADIKAKMAAYGITLDDLGGRARARKGRKAKPGRPDRAAKAAKGAKAAANGARAKPAKARKPVAAKYRDGKTGETWSGRGKPPKWLAAHEAAGRKREEFVVTP
jgi:DNA-binding protein H-NS